MEEALALVQRYFELVIEWAVILCDVIGVVMIVLTAIRGVIAWIRKKPEARLIAAEGIAIALTFKMGGEVLRTAIVREWQELKARSEQHDVRQTNYTCNYQNSLGLRKNHTVRRLPPFPNNLSSR